MTINKFNYEAFALDYLEGNLSVELTEEMERFLKTHPAIEAELSGMMEVVYLDPDTSIIFEDKAALLKEEKVVWLSKKWIRPLIAAASVMLLLMTYVVGYQAGVQQVDGLVMTDDGGSSSSSSIVAATGKKEAVDVEETLELPVVGESKVEERGVSIVSQATVKSTNIARSKELVEKEEVEYVVLDKPTEVIVEKVQVADNELIKPDMQREIIAIREIIVFTPIKTITPVFLNYASNADGSNNLANALNMDVPVEALAGITIQRKKRSIKDFLGRFPVTQLKEALIPTYYKEENAGQ